MKKYLAWLIIFILMATPTWGYATTYYACIAGDISAENAWEDAANCSGNTFTITGAFPATGDVLEANAQAMTIDVDPGPNGTVTLQNSAGGSFAITTGTITLHANLGTDTDSTVTTDLLAVSGGTVTILGDIYAGATVNGDGLAVSGATTNITVGANGSPVTVKGGGAANYAINDTATSSTRTYYANVTAGGATSAHGIHFAGTSGTATLNGTVNASANAAFGIYVDSSNAVTVNGNCTGGSSSGYHACHNGHATGTLTVNGDCEGGSAVSDGCSAGGAGGITVTGNIKASATAMGVRGKINWSPADTTPPSNYIKIWTGGTDFYYMTANPEPAVTDVKKDVTYGWNGSAAYTGTLETTGGGGASAW